MSESPLRPLPVPGAENCGCCEGVAASTPRAIDNRSGLDAISYRIGEYAQFRASLVAGLSSSRYPALAGLRTRDADDYTLALLDAVACAADVLTFYQERLANESWLRTATERVSLQEMAKLIGYRLRPGVAAETALAFAMEPPRMPPPGLPPDPGAFVTGIPSALNLPAGVKVQSVPGPDEKPQTFETVEAITARPEWNALRPWLSESRAPANGDTEAWLQGSALSLKPGDALVFVDPDFAAHPTSNSAWAVRLIDTVTPYPASDPAVDRTKVSWQTGLTGIEPYSAGAGPAEVYVLRRRVGVFGNAAPLWRSMNTQFRKHYGSPDADDWPHFTIAPIAAGVGLVDLDTVIAEVVPRSLVVLARGDAAFVQLYQVAAAREISRAEFALSGKVTRLTLSGQNLAAQFAAFPRETRVHAVSERLPLALAPVNGDVTGQFLPLKIAAGGLLPGRRLIVRGERSDGGGSLAQEVTIVSIAPDANGVQLVIAPPLPASLKRETVIVHANVARASHGETVTQVLGAGDAGRPFQRFELKRLPLTWRSAMNELGASSELTVRVGDIAWSEQPTLYGRAPVERVYRLATDEQGRQWVQFGDGLRGARLPSGVNNVRATYRQGLGADGNVASDKLTQLMSRPLGLKGVSNPLPAEGGTDAEAASQARRSMPLGTRTLGRAVSLLDYEDFALAFSGIAKAQAQVLQLTAGPTIAITLAAEHGAPLSPCNPIWQNLWAALRASGDPHVSLLLLAFQPSTFKLGLKVRRDPAYELKPLLAAVDAALRAHFAFDRRALAQPVLSSEVVAVAHSVPGVVAIDLDFLYGGSAPAAQTVPALNRRLLASRLRVAGGVAQPAELLTLDPAPLVRLEELP